MPLKIDTTQRPEFVEFASRLTGIKEFQPCKTIAFINNDSLAVVVYNGMDESNINMSIAADSPRFCTRQMIRTAFGFPFVQLGLNRVTSIIRETNHRSIKFCEGMGFTLEGELRRYYTNGDSAMIYGLLKDDCRWINE